eukprot:748525-Hanusia_phi.AAC.1
MSRIPPVGNDRKAARGDLCLELPTDLQQSGRACRASASAPVASQEDEPGAPGGAREAGRQQPHHPQLTLSTESKQAPRR